MIAPALEPDFKDRYATETRGMPANLAAIASRNLATEDAGIARVNAAARAVALPGVGATGSINTNAGLSETAVPYSTPTTDAMNYSIADSMGAADRFNAGRGAEAPPTLTDAHVDDIMQRRQQIEDARKPILAKLGMISPQEAGLAAVVLAPPHERHQLLENLSYLEGQSRDLLQEHHYASLDAARGAHENLARQTHIQAANGITKLANGLADVNQRYAKGTPEYESAVLRLKADPDIALALTTEGGRAVAGPHVEQHDSLADRSYWQTYGQAFKEASQIARKFGVDVQYDDQGSPSVEATTKFGQEKGTIKAETKPPNAAYVKQVAALAEVKARKDAAYNANNKANLNGHDRNIAIEQAKLDAMKEALGMDVATAESAAVSPPAVAAATPSPTPAAAAADKFVAGKSYKDAKGNTATYLGNGKWK